MTVEEIELAKHLAHESECEAAAMAVLRERKRELTRQFVAIWTERIDNFRRRSEAERSE